MVPLRFTLGASDQAVSDAWSALPHGELVNSAMLRPQLGRHGHSEPAPFWAVCSNLGPGTLGRMDTRSPYCLRGPHSPPSRHHAALVVAAGTVSQVAHPQLDGAARTLDVGTNPEVDQRPQPFARVRCWQMLATICRHQRQRPVPGFPRTGL